LAFTQNAILTTRKLGHTALLASINPVPLGLIAFSSGKNAFSSAFCKRTKNIVDQTRP